MIPACVCRVGTRQGRCARCVTASRCSRPGLRLHEDEGRLPRASGAPRRCPIGLPDDGAVGPRPRGARSTFPVGSTFPMGSRPGAHAAGLLAGLLATHTCLTPLVLPCSRKKVLAREVTSQAQRGRLTRGERGVTSRAESPPESHILRCAICRNKNQPTSPHLESSGGVAGEKGRSPR